MSSVADMLELIRQDKSLSATQKAAWALCLQVSVY